MQLLVTRSLEIQGNAFGAKSQVLMTDWHVMIIIHSWSCTLSSMFLLEKQGCSGVQKSPVRKTKPLNHSGWVEGLTDLFTSHVIYPSVLPDLHANVYGVILTWGQSIAMFREVKSPFSFHPPPCASSQTVATRNISVSSSWLWEMDWTNTVSSTDPWISNELDFISGMEKIFNSVSSGKSY